MKWDLKAVAVLLAGIGALAWGLLKFLSFDLVGLLSGLGTWAPLLVYGLVTASGAYILYDMFKK